jgi:translation initiation factor 2 beta subunit (eIF-2beta)/eIF-5
MSVNIGREHDNDPNYRYKMPVLQLKVERQLKILNIDKIAESLHTKPEYITKWFSIDLSTSAQYKDKTCILNGQFTKSQLDDSLHQFISYLILCANCGLPELVLKVKPNKVKQKCSAYGHSASLQDHKLVEYIIKKATINSDQ